MAYRKTTVKTACSLEITESHSNRLRPPGSGREKRKTPTPEAMRKSNQRARERKAVALMRNNFRTGDCYMTLTWKPEDRPEDMSEARREVTNFLERVKRRYARYGQELRYMANIEEGARGAWHMHIVVNELQDERKTPMAASIMSSCWPYGRIDVDHLRPDGMFRKLAEYITKTPESDPSRCRQSKMLRSRNLVKPEVETKEYTRRQAMDRQGHWKDIKVPQGYYLDETSIYEGRNLFTGFPYRRYSLIRITEGGGNASHIGIP